MKEGRLFADYLSSHLWEGAEAGGVMISVEDVMNVIPDSLLLALNYWGDIWEYFVADAGKGRASQQYYEQWNADGLRLTELINASQNVYHFTYVPS